MGEESLGTRDLIISSAKEQFYLKGYKDTTIADIFRSIDVPIGVFTYYFKTKDMLVTEIYREFFEKIDQKIIDAFTSVKERPFLMQALCSKIYYDIILSNKNNALFYYQVMEKRSNLRVNSGIIKPRFRKYIDEFNLIMTEQEFEMIVLLDAGARKEFFMDYFLNCRKISPYEVSDVIESIIPLLMRIDHNIVDSTLHKAGKIAEAMDYSDLRFLV